MKEALDAAGVDYDQKARKEDLLDLMEANGLEVKEPEPEAPAAIEADPELVKLKMKAGLPKDQAEQVALAQAKHDAAQKS